MQLVNAGFNIEYLLAASDRRPPDCEICIVVVPSIDINCFRHGELKFVTSDGAMERGLISTLLVSDAKVRLTPHPRVLCRAVIDGLTTTA
ncbi:hypothetical protein N7468_007108 [Penicillium chermesinum]|uniref:Uncharacterized protein n=1 Tax=Penicillium chermesinum TaxID=63820 RepID=A0A9W9NTU7_9EURO|nr:uncharacterized protein N7468_007108 [Penicillium chermesinum]KAJ5225883.1 hypothetical protein N7468_007108 [Penicillium chermesinum]